MAFGIPSKLTVKEDPWRVLWGFPKRHRCKTRHKPFRCTNLKSDWNGLTCWGCQVVILHPTLLKDSKEAWKTFAHELLHLANCAVAHKHIERLEPLGDILHDWLRETK